ncbi:MAG: hypothetical protein AYK19_02790 [Theionarchaea archaeon DG-70-1]|nr:MAG: hypothetical protein AYK19_02790 [Theionarchaea archaeon DG-70-1]
MLLENVSSGGNTMLRALCQSVVTPRSFLENPEGYRIVQYGWLFIIARWLANSFIFSFRDYYGFWKPFAPPPFGLNVDTYAFVQKYFSVVFGVGLMVAISVGLSGYLRMIEKGVPVVDILNILGITFFLPWVVVQVIDFAVVYTVGWVGIVVIPVHAGILVWESAAATEVISGTCNLKLIEKVISTAVIMVIWILLCTVLWR